MLILKLLCLFLYECVSRTESIAIILIIALCFVVIIQCGYK